MADLTTAVKSNKGFIIGALLIGASLFALYYFTKSAKTPETPPTPEPSKGLTQAEADALVAGIVGAGRMGLTAEVKAKNKEIEEKLKTAGYNVSCTGSIDTSNFKCVAVKIEKI